MKTIALIGLFILIATAGFGQDSDTKEKIEAARIAFLTERLELTPEQAEKFWPLYREYLEKRESLRQEFIAARKEVDRNNLTEEESKRLVDLGLKLKGQETDLQKTYSERLSRVISNRQLLELRRSEEDFRRMLLERLERRREIRERVQQRRKEIDN